MKIFRTVMDRLHRRPLPIALQGRPELDLSELVAPLREVTGLDEDDIQEVWLGVADAFRLRPGLIRSTDRFGVELTAERTFAGTTEDIWLAELLTRLERKHGIERIPDPESLRELLTFIAAHRTS